ncbi:class I SAM-dependent methyltransferase [Paenibacillus sp. UMB4589-SE434]|uniref:class I SAM-dependent methyltransferase n=1 Tax=Paenibacillus sp. UMB4589-SE434 TaxID=3046314 RepID=UPI00254AB6E9|nr:class I SAM-dependent methyltransferase [Paenibacillus sp. UMB4589-SE434]MDK8183226.1 class I SAM-dependent methyltransferase [Paenibacillus sp. UMB4589-SE434]
MDRSTALFDKMLTFTSSAFFELESSLLLGQVSSSAQHVLDVGCGNGDYLARYINHFPQAQAIGLDLDPFIIQQAKDRNGEAIAFYNCSYENLPVSDPFDTILARLVIDHISDRTHFWNWLQQRAAINGSILITDINGYGISDSTKLPLFTSMYKGIRDRIRRPSFLRLQDSLRLEMKQFRFHHVTTTEYQLAIHTKELRAQFYHYLRSVTELMTAVQSHLHTPFDHNRNAIYEELENWLISGDDTMEISMFCLHAKRI